MADPREPYPTLRTERIILREPTLEDCGAYHLILSQHEVTQYINILDAPAAERSRKFVGWMMKLNRRNKGCAWIMEHATTGRVMGAVRIDAISQSSRIGTVGYEMHPEFCTLYKHRLPEHFYNDPRPRANLYVRKFKLPNDV